jgi:hypothetical protein
MACEGDRLVREGVSPMAEFRYIIEGEPLRPRLAWSFALIPFAFGALFAFMYAGMFADQRIVYALAYVGPSLIYFYGGLLIWWRTVRWTRFRLWFTLIVAVVNLALHGWFFTIILLEWFDSTALLYTAMLSVFSLPPVLLVIINRVNWDRPDGYLAIGPIRCPQCATELNDCGTQTCAQCGYTASLGELAQACVVAEVLGLDPDESTLQIARKGGA